MNRGVARQRVFFAARDGHRFTALLAEGYEEFGVEVHAYCLMDNHFHLLVRCPEGGLSPYMQRIGSVYTRYLNERLARDGPIFRGRFRSLLIDSDQYLACAGRYIHRNPLDVRPPVALDEYRWSSFRAYCGLAESPPWLKRWRLTEMHGGTDEYRAFVEAGERVPGSIDWAIATAIAEVPDDQAVARPGVGKTIAVAMLTLSEDRIAAELESKLSFPNPRARREAERRASRRIADQPSLGAVARRALELAA